MSVALMSLVFKCNMPELKTDKSQTVPDSTAKFVLLALADHANDEGEGAYPSVKTICKKTNLSTATVVAALNALRFNGFAEMVGKSKRKTCNYTISAAKIASFQWLESDDSNGQNDNVLATENKPLENHPKKPSVKKGGVPKATVIPEVSLFREVTGRYPSRDTYSIVVQAVQTVSSRLGRCVTKEDLIPFWQAWRSKDYRPTNLSWLTEWAVSGTISNGFKKPASSTPTPPAETPEQLAVRIALAAELLGAHK